MRIATLGFHHETNTFQSVKTDYDSFANFEFLRGSEIADRHATSKFTLAGYFQSAQMFEFDLVPLLFAFTGPTGTITKDTFDRISEEMIDKLKQNGPWDGVLLAQHGAAVTEEYPDMDGEISRRVREVVGPDTPVVMTLDLHCNITQDQVANTDAIVVFRTNPHLDAVERAVEASEILVKTIRGEVRPVQHLVQVPMMINIVKQPTGFGPMKEIMDEVHQVLEKPGVLSASCGQGFPYADVDQMGVSFLVVTDGDAVKAEKQAKSLARKAWDLRAELQNDSPSIEESISRAMNASSDGKPTAIMDVGDNVGGGGTADSTHLLAEATSQGLSGDKSLLLTLFDPTNVQVCISAGVGSTITLKVGAGTDRLHGEPIEVTANIRAITDGKFEEPKPTHGGLRFFDYGPSVALDTEAGHTIVLHTVRGIGNMSREQYYSIGIRPEEYRVIICKGTVSPRAAYEPISREIIMANSPGVTSANMSSFSYENRRTPLYPFELDTTFD
ncbi:MAG: M81 family metallopeptidase [Chloroflexi bacterium]|jgi:microcystin degradation protein MlrC|nr:M81 family metallopeptidase [Chloroflexota bacterium]MBT4342188.1 M81 family metallopeptidase [Chloroflexota bacterium]MBT5253233.1 M81 family metallopeptidase [Chloroflexota bacterium]MBT6708381.1 M81 family metallopeptidase [Chloroflexota bacterium]MBT7004082.1 M81 family metallopeptidase [Chloroflexota bacterium]